MLLYLFITYIATFYSFLYVVTRKLHNILNLTKPNKYATYKKEFSAYKNIVIIQLIQN